MPLSHARDYIHRAYKLWSLNREVITANLERRNALLFEHNLGGNFPERVFKESQPVFFLSTGRCGTAMVTEMLKQNRKALVLHSPTPELSYVNCWAYEHGRTHPEELKAALLAARFEFIADAALRSRCYIETNNRVTFFAPAISDLFPRARFVHICRHPIKFIESAVRLGFYDGIYTDIGRIRPISGSLADSWEEITPFERAAWLWNETNTWIEEFKQQIDTQKILTVHSEQLFSNTETSKSIFEFCDIIPPESSTLQKMLTRPVNRKSSRTRVAPSCKWSEPLKHRLEKLLPLAAHYEYLLWEKI